MTAFFLVVFSLLPRPKRRIELFKQPLQRSVVARRLIQVHFLHDIVREFDATQTGRNAAFPNGVNKHLFVARTLALLIRRIAASSEDLLERARIDQ